MPRRADISDISAIKEIAEIAFRDTYRHILSPEQMEYMMDWMYSERSLYVQMAENHHTFFIEDGVGYVSFRPDGISDDGSPLFHLEKLYVLPEFKGKGYGRALFDKVVESVKSLSGGSARMELNVNRFNSAVTFYEHLGMKKARSGDFPIGNGFYMNDYIMSIDF